VPLDAEFFAEMRARSGATFDTANVLWLVDQFRRASAELSPSTQGIDLRTRTANVAPQDTGRVLARARGVPCTVGRVIEAYNDIPRIGRRRLLTRDAMFDFVQRLVLEPDVVAAAREAGLERDPDIVAQLARLRESLLVQHLYEDSVQAQVQVTAAMRRRYFQDHPQEFFTREHVRFAVIPRATEAGADSVIERLDRGESATAIITADSLAGERRDYIKDLREGDTHPFYAMLFQELREHQSAKMYMGRDAVWGVFHIMLHEPARPMSYEEARESVDRVVDDVESERILNQLLKRWSARFRIESHPEWVMRIKLTVPTGG
jgi:hypothetical protein